MISAVGRGRGLGARVVVASSVVVVTVGGRRRVGRVSGTMEGVVGLREVVVKMVSSEDSEAGVVVGRRLITVVLRTVVEVVVDGFLVVVVGFLVVVVDAVVVVVGLRVTNDHEVFRWTSGRVVMIAFGVVV